MRCGSSLILPLDVWVDLEDGSDSSFFEHDGRHRQELRLPSTDSPVNEESSQGKADDDHKSKNESEDEELGMRVRHCYERHVGG